MIVDAHAHVFPAAFVADRASIVARDATFAEMYRDPGARMATGEALLASMEAAGVATTWVHGFAWSSPDDVRAHNNALARLGREAGDRVRLFGPLQPRAPGAAGEVRRLHDEGFIGIGELRPGNQGYSLDDERVREVFALARELRMVLAFHVSEPVGHTYPGKGGLAIDEFVRFASWYAPGRIIAAHLGGGLPFYMTMPEVREALRSTWFDTAAWHLLYDPIALQHTLALAGAERLLFGSDFALLSQARQVERLRDVLPPADAARVLGANAAALLAIDTVAA